MMAPTSGSVIATAAVTVVLLLGVHSPANAAPATFTAEADTYVNEGSPTLSYGVGKEIRVDGSPIANSYLRFNVQGVNGNVASATLRIFANSSQIDGFSVHDVADDSWNEETTNYANAPAISTTAVDSSGPVTTGQTYDLDVTALVVGNGLHSFGLKATSQTALALASRESVNPPQLIVDTTSAGVDPAETGYGMPLIGGAAALAIVGLAAVLWRRRRNRRVKV